MPIASCPSSPRASSTRAAERSETTRSSELPSLEDGDPHGRLGMRDDLAPPARRPRLGLGRCPVLAGDRLVERDLLGDDVADAADALAQLVLGGGGEVEAHRGAPAAVDVGGSPGDEGDVLAKRLGEQVGGVDVVGQGGPDEQAALGLGPLRLLAGSGARARRASRRGGRGRSRPGRRCRSASGPPRSTRGRSTGSGSRCRDRRPACRARSSPAPAAARRPSRSGCPGRGSSRGSRYRGRSRRRRGCRGWAAPRPRSGAGRRGCPRRSGPRAPAPAPPGVAGAPRTSSPRPGSGSSARSR